MARARRIQTGQSQPLPLERTGTRIQRQRSTVTGVGRVNKKAHEISTMVGYPVAIVIRPPRKGGALGAGRLMVERVIPVADIPLNRVRRYKTIRTGNTFTVLPIDKQDDFGLGDIGELSGYELAGVFSALKKAGQKLKAGAIKIKKKSFAKLKKVRGKFKKSAKGSLKEAIAAGGAGFELPPGLLETPDDVLPPGAEREAGARTDTDDVFFDGPSDKPFIQTPMGIAAIIGGLGLAAIIAKKAKLF